MGGGEILLAGIAIGNPDFGPVAVQHVLGNRLRPARGDLVQDGVVGTENPSEPAGEGSALQSNGGQQTAEGQCVVPLIRVVVSPEAMTVAPRSLALTDCRSVFSGAAIRAKAQEPKGAMAPSEIASPNSSPIARAGRWKPTW